MDRRCLAALFLLLEFRTLAAQDGLLAALAADDACLFDGGCSLSALQQGAEAVSGQGIDFDAEVKQPLESLAAELDSSVNTLLAKMIQAVMDWKLKGRFDKDDLKKASSETRMMLGKVIPKTWEAFDKSSAFNPDASLTGRADEAQSRLLEFLKFNRRMAPLSCEQARVAAGDDVRSSEFVARVSKEIATARRFLNASLTYAWDGITRQINNLEVILHDKEHHVAEHVVDKASCASDFARSLGLVTRLHSTLVSAEVDCDSANSTNYDAMECAASTTEALRGMSEAVGESSEMMTTCYSSNWACTRHVAKSSQHLLGALGGTLTLTMDCNSGSKTQCESAAFKIFADLSSSASHLRRAASLCKAAGER